MRTQGIPTAAAILGAAGAIPFVLGTLGFWLLPPAEAAHALDAQVFYGVTVLAFLGAVHWGAAFAEGPDADRLWARLGWGVTPALIAWAAAMMTAVPALMTLMAGLGAAYVVDLRARDRGDVPGWYLDLRRRLTALALLALGSSLLRAL